MAITTNDGYLASTKQNTGIVKTTTRTTVAAQPFSLFDIAGNPGAGTLAVGNTANGLVHTASTAGYPALAAFGGGATGYLTKATWANSIACTLNLYDRIFSCGAYAFNASTTLASQPSFAGRNGGTYSGLEIWVEQVTAATGNQAVNVQYTDPVNGAGRTTGAVGIGAAPTVGRMWQLPLAAGDTGVSLIEKVTGTVAAAGTFNVHVMRRICMDMDVRIANAGGARNYISTGAPIVYATSAFFLMVYADSTSSGLPRVSFEVANG